MIPASSSGQNIALVWAAQSKCCILLCGSCSPWLKIALHPQVEISPAKCTLPPLLSLFTFFHLPTAAPGVHVSSSQHKDLPGESRDSPHPLWGTAQDPWGYPRVRLRASLWVVGSLGVLDLSWRHRNDCMRSFKGKQANKYKDRSLSVWEVPSCVFVRKY